MASSHKFGRIRNSGIAGISTALIAVLTASSALAAISVETAAISAGKLEVKGVSSRGTTITLDSAYQLNLGAGGSFSFVVNNYHPSSCIVELRDNVAGSKAVKAVIANCGLRGLTARGAWSLSLDYKTDDVVTRGGSRACLQLSRMIAQAN